MEYAPRLLGVDEVSVNLSGLIKRGIDRSLGDLIKHHPEGRFGRALWNDLFRQMLANGFPFPVRVSSKVNGVRFFGRRLEFCNDFLIVSFPGIRSDLIGRFEIIVAIDTDSFSRQ